MTNMSICIIIKLRLILRCSFFFSFARNRTHCKKSLKQNYILSQFAIISINNLKNNNNIYTILKALSHVMKTNFKILFK